MRRNELGLGRLVNMAAALVAGTWTWCAPAEGKARQADFNGDGRADLAIGVPIETVAGFSGAGGVAVIYGRNSNGLNAANDQFWTADTDGINGEAQQNANFGSALAAGDFDNDGFSDLAIGEPRTTVGGVAGAGAIHVLYGSASGLRSNGDQKFTRETEDVPGDATAQELFGSVLEAGDFDGNGKDDLAIGIPGFDYSGQDNAGQVMFLYGRSSGLGVSGAETWDVRSVQVDPLENDRFGTSLAAGDFDNNGQDDLAIGVPFMSSQTDGDEPRSGGVVVLYSERGDGIGSTRQLLQQGFEGLDANGGDGDDDMDEFGAVVEAGDFDGNGKDDLAITKLREDVGGDADAGGVHVVYGSSSGLRPENDEFWTQDSSGILDAAAPGELWGVSLAAGDFDGDGRDDLAVGCNYEDVSGLEDAGAANVIYGSSSGLRASGNQLWHQDREGIRDKCEDADYMGEAMTAGDYDDDGKDDLAISVAAERLNAQENAGGVNVIYGGSGGLSKSGNQFWHQDAEGINDSVQMNDQFGQVLR